MSLNIGDGVNISQMEAQLNAVDEFSKQTALKVVGITRQLYDTILIGASFLGATIDQSYQMMAQSAFAGAETIIAIRGALAAGTFGASEFLTAGLGAVSTFALFAVGYQALMNKDKASYEIDNLILTGRFQQAHAMSNIWRMR